MKEAQERRHHPRPLRRPAGPRPLLASGRPVRQLVGTAAGDAHRRGPGRAGGGGRAGRRRHGPRRRPLWEAGADGINFDTAGAGGDADFLATLLAVERLRAKYPAMGIMVGMAGEIVLGTHGELEYHGTRLAGLKPEGQCRVVQEAGATVFGPAVNVNTSRTVAWNVARALTFMKPCMDVARIPVHANVGMGVGGVPMNAFARSTPSRAARAPASTSCRSTACRWAPATPSACRSRTPSPRG